MELAPYEITLSENVYSRHPAQFLSNDLFYLKIHIYSPFIENICGIYLNMIFMA